MSKCELGIYHLQQAFQGCSLFLLSFLLPARAARSRIFCAAAKHSLYMNEPLAPRCWDMSNSQKESYY